MTLHDIFSPPSSPFPTPRRPALARSGSYVNLEVSRLYRDRMRSAHVSVSVSNESLS
jgi:hypothetical protein